MTHTISEEDGITFLRLSGSLTMESMGDCFMEMIAILEKKPDARFLVSYSEVTDNQISAEEVRGLSQGINMNSQGPTSFKMAFVMPEDLEFGMGRMFMANIEENSSYATFRDDAAARIWLEN